nr:MAG TPA: hypothetical protein [Caudoviricetes sp.]
MSDRLSKPLKAGAPRNWVCAHHTRIELLEITE